MLVVMQSNATEEQVLADRKRIGALGFQAHLVPDAVPALRGLRCEQ